MAEVNVATLEAGDTIDGPAGLTAWPDPVFPMPPLEYMQRSRTDIIHYASLEEGGHFPMIERPDFYVSDLRQFGREVRRLPSMAVGSRSAPALPSD